MRETQYPRPTFSGMQGVATSCRYGTDAYASGRATGETGFAIVTGDDSDSTNLERYGAFFANVGAGTGDPAVISTSFGAGIASLKKNWDRTSRPGQTCGVNITTRGGYHGPDANAALPQFGGYNPAGDVTAIIVNSVQSSPYGQNSLFEGVAYFAQGGAFDASGNVHGMNVQFGSMRMLSPDGSVANPGIGLALSAASGSLSYAIQITNTARPGTYGFAPGIWAGGFRYNFDNGGSIPPYDAFRIEQDGAIFMSAGVGPFPNKILRAGANGRLQVLSTAENVVAEVGDDGRFYIDNQQVLGPRQPAISDALSDDQKLAQVLAVLRAHGLIGS